MVFEMENGLYCTFAWNAPYLKRCSGFHRFRQAEVSAPARGCFSAVHATHRTPQVECEPDKFAATCAYRNAKRATEVKQATSDNKKITK